MKHHETMKHHEPMKHHEASYEHEVDKPHEPKSGHKADSMGCSDYKKQAMDIAYGQASQSGCKADGTKIIGQFKNYGWTE
jgi:hypothetical protein